MEPQAAALPDGSIVATDLMAWIKTRSLDGYPWRGTNGGVFANVSVDDYLATGGATVVRRGTGQP